MQSTLPVCLLVCFGSIFERSSLLIFPLLSSEFLGAVPNQTTHLPTRPFPSIDLGHQSANACLVHSSSCTYSTASRYGLEITRLHPLERPAARVHKLKNNHEWRIQLIRSSDCLGIKSGVFSRIKQVVTTGA